MQVRFTTFAIVAGLVWLTAGAGPGLTAGVEPPMPARGPAAIPSSFLVDIDGLKILGGLPYTGIVVDSYPDGARKARYSVFNGRVEGAWTEWHPGGGVSFYGEWKNGLGEGPFLYFHPNGEIRERATARADVWDGVAEGWHENGVKAFERIYRKGEMVSEVRFTETGEAIP